MTSASPILGTAIAFVSGAVLGIAFFLGLFYTIRFALSSRYAPLWFSLSLVIRACVVMAGFYFVGNQDLLRFTATMVGFLLARHVLRRLILSQKGCKATIGSGAYHAS